jgi:hypothetical protein
VNHPTGSANYADGFKQQKSEKLAILGLVGGYEKKGIAVKVAKPLI